MTDFTDSVAAVTSDSTLVGYGSASKAHHLDTTQDGLVERYHNLSQLNAKSNGYDPSHTDGEMPDDPTNDDGLDLESDGLGEHETSN